MIRESYKIYSSPSSWYTLKYPNSWEFKEYKECTTFNRKMEAWGALQISAFQTDTPQSATKQLVDYLEEEEIVVDVKTDFKPEGEEIALSSYRKSESNMKVGFITRSNYLLFITYILIRLSTREK